MRIPTNHAIEEETIPGYIAGRYYPIRVGEILKEQYQIVGKLGFGASSTVWLARDMEYEDIVGTFPLSTHGSSTYLKYSYRRYVTVKVFIKSTSMGQQLDDELEVYKRIEEAPRRHPGRKYVRSLLDSFDINGPEDKHQCLVHPPLWESVLDFLFRNPVQRLPAPILAVTLHRLFLALDYLHTKCKIIHTGTALAYLF